MTLLFAESFDNVTASTITNGGRWTYADVQYLNSSYDRWGTGYGVRLRYNDERIDKNNFPSSTYDTFVLGFAFRTQEGVSPSLNISYPFFRLYESAIQQINVYVNSAWQFDVRRGTTSLGVSTKRIDPYRWYYLEFKVTIHDTTGAFELRIDEENWLSDSGINTKNGGDGYITGFTMRCIYDMIINFDDVYVDDSDFHGDVRIKSFLPTSDGSHLDFIASAGNRYECVDETPTHNSDTDYVSKDTLNAKQTFKYTTGALQTVKGVQLSNVLRKDNAGIVGIKNLCRSNGTDYLATNEKIPTTTYTFESDIFETDPDDSNAWTQTKLEAAEFGLQITSVP